MQIYSIEHRQIIVYYWSRLINGYLDIIFFTIMCLLIYICLKNQWGYFYTIYLLEHRHIMDYIWSRLKHRYIDIILLPILLTLNLNNLDILLANILNRTINRHFFDCIWFRLNNRYLDIILLSSGNYPKRLV